MQHDRQARTSEVAVAAVSLAGLCWPKTQPTVQNKVDFAVVPALRFDEQGKANQLAGAKTKTIISAGGKTTPPENQTNFFCPGRAVCACVHTCVYRSLHSPCAALRTVIVGKCGRRCLQRRLVLPLGKLLRAGVGGHPNTWVAIDRSIDLANGLTVCGRGCCLPVSGRLARRVNCLCARVVERDTGLGATRQGLAFESIITSHSMAASSSRTDACPRLFSAHCTRNADVVANVSGRVEHEVNR